MTNQAINVINLPVYTVSGQHLGRISGIEVDSQGKEIVYYQISAALPLANLWGKKILVSPNQVVSISKEKMVVIDLSIQSKAKTNPNPGLAPEPSA